MSQFLRAHIALFIVNLMYGANYVVAKGLMPNIIGPNGFIWMRVSGATLIFWIIFNKSIEKIDKSDWVRIIGCAVFGVTVNQLCFFNGLMRTSPVNAAVIMTTTPIIVLILSTFLLREKIRLPQLFGVLIGAIAAIIFSAYGKVSEFSTSSGDIFIFVNAFSYAIYLIMVKKLMAKYKPITVITYVFTIGLFLVSLWPYSISEFMEVDWASTSNEDILRFIFVVIGVTVVPYSLMVYALKRLSPSITSIYIYLQPLLAAFFVYVFYLLGKEDYTDDFSYVKTICAIFIFAGVYLVIKPPKEVKKID